MYESKYDPIPEYTKQMILELAAPKMESKNIGLIYLDKVKMTTLFAPYIKKHFGNDMRFDKAWVHFMRTGGERPRHHHNGWTYLYYLEIPDGDSGSLLFDDHTIKPVEGTHIIFPKDTKHSISPNKTGKIRWAFAANCVRN